MYCISSGIRSGCLMILLWLTGFNLFTACYRLPQTNLEVNASPENPSPSLNIIEKNKLIAARVTIASLLDQSTTTPSVSEKILQGQITQVAPFLQGQAYKLTDETGEFWVVSRAVDLINFNSQADSQPISVLVKGLVRYQSISAGGKDWGEIYLEEQQRFTLD